MKHRINDIFDNAYLKLVILLLILMLNLIRLRYGVDFTDESWYVAEPFLVAKGLVPFAEIWSQSPGFTMPLCFFYRFFLNFTNSTDGIVMFSRVLYFFWSTAIVLATYWMCRKNLSIYFFYPMLCVSIFSLFDINYNTIGFFYSFFSTMGLFARNNQDDEESLVPFFSGVCIARAVLGTPSTYIIILVSIMALLFMKKVRSLIFYFVGGGLFASLIVSVITYKTSLKILVDGLLHIVRDSSYRKVPPISTIQSLTNHVKITVFIVTLSIYILLRLLKVDEKIRKKVYTIVLSGIYLYGIVLAMFLKINAMIFLCFFETFIAYFEIKTDKVNAGLLVVQISNCLWYVSSSLMSFSKFSGRGYILFISCIISAYFLSQLMIETFDFRLGELLYLLLCIDLLFSNYKNVYKDSEISKLEETVELGIWKGCRTTSKKHRAIVFFENEIDKYVKEKDKVLFLDWVSWGYLMSNGEAFTPSALDNELYSYEIGNPQIMLDYFKLRNDEPDKIVYCDFGRDDKLSIEDEDWQFNDFVNLNYRMVHEAEEDAYRIIVYERY